MPNGGGADAEPSFVKSWGVTCTMPGERTNQDQETGIAADRSFDTAWWTRS
jgi:hypothetical protein